MTIAPSQPARADHVSDVAASNDTDIGFDDIWTDVRARIERAQKAVPDAPSFGSFDEIQQAINELRAALAQAPISLRDSSDANAPAETGSDQSADAVRVDVGELTQDPVERLDKHLADVDTAYAQAQSAGHPTTDPGWAGIHAIHSAVHNLWDTIKAAAGTYWAQVAVDARIHGLLTTLATRAARAIASLANAAADRLDQRTSPQTPSTVRTEPTLREAYISARSHIRAHAASHEWQRIAALWNTVNTLTRQTDDPGIRAVVARSADAISDYSDALARKAMQRGNQADTTDALGALARAAERHAVALRGAELQREQRHDRAQLQTAAQGGPQVNDTPPLQRNPDAQALQARAHQVAQRVRARLGQGPIRTTHAPQRSLSTGSPHGERAVTRPMQPTAPSESASVQAR